MIKCDCDWAGKIIYSLNQREMDELMLKRAEEAIEEEKRSRRLALIRSLIE